MSGVALEAPPPGYLSWSEGTTDVVALEPVARAIREALREGTLFDYAAHHPDAKPLRGRGVAYAVPLPGEAAHGVVRRSRHGGLLAPLTGEAFLGDTRAPRELAVSLRLTTLSVPTPEVLAYATYYAGPMVRRADVVTRFVPDSSDLAERLMHPSAERDKDELLVATAELLARMAIARARHPDLNLKNILIARDTNGRFEALLLDVDRVWFDRQSAERATAANLRRLARSAGKWRRTRDLPLHDGDLLTLAQHVTEMAGLAARPAG